MDGWVWRRSECVFIGFMINHHLESYTFRSSQRDRVHATSLSSLQAEELAFFTFVHSSWSPTQSNKNHNIASTGGILLLLYSYPAFCLPRFSILACLMSDGHAFPYQRAWWVMATLFHFHVLHVYIIVFILHTDKSSLCFHVDMYLHSSCILSQNLGSKSMQQLRWPWVWSISVPDEWCMSEASTMVEFK